MFEQEIANVENYYADLLIIQYRNKPKARATIKLGTNLYLADELLFDLSNVLDIDSAVGPQLDLIGKILGVGREIAGLTLNKDYFTFEKTIAYGYSDAQALSQGYWKKYNNSIGSIYMLDDTNYRALLKFKALYNSRYGSMGGMDLLYWKAFGDDVNLINNKDLSVTYEVTSTLSDAINAAIYLGYIEPPMGISFTITYV